MKKVMLVLVGLLVVSTFAFALESGPSNKVGYVKIACPGSGTPGVSTYTQFGLPFKFWNVPTGNIPQYGVESRRPSSIVGTQANCGSSGGADRIMRQDNSQYAWRNTAAGCAWTGSLETSGPAQMEPGRAYWYRNTSGAARNLVLAGEADTTAAGIPTVNVGAYTAYSWRDPRDLSRDRLNLLAQGFTGGTSLSSDKVLIQTTAATSFYYRTSDNTWQGTLTTITPGVAYWIMNKHLPAHPWTYLYTASGAGLLMPGGGSELQKISAPAVVPTEKSRTATK